jgi:DNA polymerase-3 subunit alpha
MSFTHLHNHSHYSLLQALPKIPDLVKKAKEDGMTAIGLTDAGNMYGAIEFYQECLKKEIKPILGVDFYVAARTRHDRESRIDNKRTRLILLAKDFDGYKNLIKLVTRSNMEGFYYKPRIDDELLEAHHNGLVCIMPSFSGTVALALKNNDTEKAKAETEKYKKWFGDDFYLEVTHHPELEGHEENMQKLVGFAKETNTPIVAAHDTYYLNEDDKRARETLVSIQNDYTERVSGGDKSDWSFISKEKAEELFKDTPDALENVDRIVEKCNLDLPLGKWLFPNFIVESGRSHDEELRHIVFEGIAKRGLEKTPELLERVEYELSVINEKGYAPYFLVVGDLLREAHEREILTTIRGSVAGSMVTYLANITNVNPMEYMLPFERFLNPMRPSAPDVDMDYADNRRDEIISYARDKYGHDKVAQIGTFGTMMARGAVRDVARALGYEYSTGDRIAKLIPMGAQGAPMTIDKALTLTPELKKMYDDEEDIKEVIDMAKKIEGCARHISVHAAGVVISPIPLDEIVPTQMDPKGEGKIITQYDMHSVDENSAGLLKFDFLGIRNLSILADAVKLVRIQKGIEVDIENVPVDDKKTFEMLARGETMGLFQLNGDGMTKALVELKPSSIHDINVMVALYRPGPMDTIQEYIARKHGKSKTTFYHPKMKKFLERTFGLLVYQDDLLYTAIELAGYDWGTVDKFRKAVGKKIPAEMAKQHVIFVEGCEKFSGMSKRDAEKIWDLFEPFQGYGFNKAHAASYGKVAYQTAYMKANFPALYMAAALTAESGDTETIGQYITECKRMGIPVLPPDVNESFKGFTVVEQPKAGPEGQLGAREEVIRFGLVTIKNFGEGIADSIIKERQAHGKFVSLEDFLVRIKDRNLNKKSLESLIKAGAMDAFGDRGVLLSNLDHLLTYNKETSALPAHEDTLFGSLSKEDFSAKLVLDAGVEATMDEKLGWEKELLGLYISGHPLDKFKEKFEKSEMNIAKLKEISRPLFLEPLVFPEGTSKDKIKKEKERLKKEKEKMYVVAGMVTAAREIITKTNTRMMFLTLTDLTDSIECIVFSRTYEAMKELFVLDACIAIKGKMNERNGELSLVVEKAKKL